MKIGLFDSGIGGIAVLKKLVERFPKFDYLYLADTKRAPFGTKRYEDLKEIVRDDIEILQSFGADLIVAACNTADSVATDMNISIPYISIIDSGVDMIKKEKIGIIATEATVKLGSYAKRLKGKRVVQRSLQNLVSIVEKNMNDKDLIKSVLKRAFDDEIFKCDEVILGCTHFSLISDTFKEVLKTRVLDPSDRIVEKLTAYDESGSGEIEILVTSDLDSFRKKVQKFGILSDVNLKYRQVDIDEKSHSNIRIVGIR